MSAVGGADLTEEQVAFRKVVRDFADREVAPHAEAWDRDHTFPLDVVLAMGDLGFFGLTAPEERGGAGADLTTLCLAIEELARVDSSVAITLSAGVGLGINPILTFGTDDQKARWLPDLVAGRALGAFGLTEPDAGSDAAATRTRARRDGDDWVLDGAKAFITNSGTPITSVVTVTARTEAGISAFLVPAGTPGLVIEPPYRKVGWHASDTHGLVFDGCRIPAANLLGTEGDGLRQLLAILDDGRIAIAALACGLIRGCLEESVRYANERQAFGGPIGRFQAIAFMCADLAVLYESSAALTYRAAARKDQGRPCRQEAAIAKLHATTSAVTAARQATQIFGGTGFLDETPVARHWRDSKILEIGEGTSEVQRIVISRGLGLPA
ncbi:MAG: acyl-CoA dehydrogenase family protein [Acidimicrobiales bacterium]